MPDNSAPHDTPDRKWAAAKYASRVAYLAEKKAMQRALYIGREVEWTQGAHVVTGTVVRHGYGVNDVIVRGDRSGKEYRLSAFRILDCMGLNPKYPRDDND